MKPSAWHARVVDSGVLIASVAVLVMMAVGAGDAVSTFLGHPIPGALELAELLMVLVVFLALPDAEARGKHIRIDLVSRRLPGAFARPVGILQAVLTFAFYAAMAWQAWRLFGDSWAIREHTAGLVKFPVFPAKALFALGLSAVTVIAGWNLVGSVTRRPEPPASAPDNN